MPKCANPLFLKWVKEFDDEKNWRKRRGPPRPTGYENAVRALQACTEKYEHPKELLKLSGIGPTCVERLTAKLEEYCEHRRIPMPEYKPPPRKKAGPRKKQRERMPEVHGNMLEIIEADDDSYPTPSVPTSRTRYPRSSNVPGISYTISDSEEGDNPQDNDDYSNSEDEVPVGPSEEPKFIRRTKQVARRPRYKPNERPQAFASGVAKSEEIIEISDDGPSNKPTLLSDTRHRVDPKAQLKRKAPVEDEDERAGEEEYVPPLKSSKISQAERARLAAKRRRGGL